MVALSNRINSHTTWLAAKHASRKTTCHTPVHAKHSFPLRRYPKRLHVGDRSSTPGTCQIIRRADSYPLTVLDPYDADARYHFQDEDKHQHSRVPDRPLHEEEKARQKYRSKRSEITQGVELLKKYILIVT